MAKQHRGKSLKEHIRATLKGIIETAQKEGKAYKYNQSELSRAASVSRPTLDKYSPFIDEILKNCEVERKIEYGQAGIQQFLDRIARLEERNKTLEKEVGALRSQHLRIHEVLYEQSIDAHSLVGAVLKESANALQGKVVDITRKKR